MNRFWEHMATRMTTGEFDEGLSVSPKVAKKASVKSVAGTPQLKDGDKESASVNTTQNSRFKNAVLDPLNVFVELIFLLP